MRSKKIALCCCWLALLALATAQGDSRIPRFEGESFTGRKVVLPDEAAGSVAVLIFGFSKASKGPTSDWARKLSGDLGSRTGFALYQLPVLEDVPRIIRGIVISGIKKGVPENQRDHFVPILQGENELKKAVHYSEPDDAYLVVMDRSGNTVQMMHGALSEAAYAPVREKIDSLLSQVK